ncbi:MAG TPA: hypothetical protein VI251_06480 [Pseudolabrys sp.]|jgi:hypothetical protein
MWDLVTEDDLARARTDPAFRQKLLAQSLDRLLAALNRMRRSRDPGEHTAKQIREGVDLAVQLADRLQANAADSGPQAA